MDRREFIKTSVIGAAAGSIISGAPAVHAKKTYEWKMVSAFPKNLPGVGGNPHIFAELIKKMSSNRLQIKVYGPGELVEAFDVFRAVSEGEAEMGTGTPYYWRPKHEAFIFCSNIPFGLNAHELFGWINYGGGQALLDELYGKFGLKPFPMGNSGVQMGGWFNREITSTSDFKGLKMRIPGLGGEVLSRAGADVVILPAHKILDALRKGEIEAAEWIAPFDDLNLELFRAAKYYYWPAWHEPSAMQDCFINLKAYESLTPDLKCIIEQAALSRHGCMWAEYSAKNGAALLELVNTHKVTLKRFSDRVLMDLAKLSSEVVGEIAAKDPFTQKLYASYNAYKKTAIGWTQISEEAFSLARSLTYPYL